MSFLVRTHIPLAPLTTLHTGGEALYYTEIKEIADLEKAVVFAHEKQLPFCVLGGGSNLLVKDEGYPGLILKQNLKGITTMSDDGTCEVTVLAGENLDELVAEVTDRNLWGLENLSHIPGTVGATPVQNVGAYGVEVADVIIEVTVFDTDTKKVQHSKMQSVIFHIGIQSLKKKVI